MKHSYTGLLVLVGLLFNTWASAEEGLFSPPRTTPKAIAQVSETEQCVEPVEVMRRQHMDFILHQRDETMRKGIRTTRHSLLECVNCHVTHDAQGKAVGTENPQHFCRSCHDYAAVSIDCFQCHNSKPTESIVKPIPGHKDFIHPMQTNAAPAVSEEGEQ